MNNTIFVYIQSLENLFMTKKIQYFSFKFANFYFRFIYF